MPPKPRGNHCSPESVRCFPFTEYSPGQPFERDLELLLSLEILEPGWRSALEGLQSISRSGWDGAMEQDGEHLLVYLVYRYYLSWGLERGDQEFPLRFGLFSLRLLAALRQMTLEETGSSPWPTG